MKDLQFHWNNPFLERNMRLIWYSQTTKLQKLSWLFFEMLKYDVVRSKKSSYVFLIIFLILFHVNFPEFSSFKVCFKAALLLRNVLK